MRTCRFNQLPTDQQLLASNVFFGAGPDDGCIYDVLGGTVVARQVETSRDTRQMSLGFAGWCACGKPEHIKHCCPFSRHGECGG
jgi:hypothetical protein